MGAADKRVADLLDRWLQSVDLHARYLELDAEAYAKVQDWPKHQRPTRWVVELARARLEELRTQLAERQAKHDDGFAESLELMAFLANLLGTENIERFVPLAVPRPPGQQPRAAALTSDALPEDPVAVKPVSVKPAKAAPAAPSARPGTDRATKPAHKPVAKERPAQRPQAGRSPEADQTVVSDAVRFLSWGREWPALASLIARLANRPSESEVWAILKRNRAAIESRAQQGLDRR
ncbi:MAG TPA: hypothetical protein VLM41_04505 [Steroidobacteraceae bacterium]|nr:hypothetical protein [Steroidobacteraceae bacterium]